MISILLCPEETDFVDCVLMDFLSCNHFDDDNFMKCIEEISQSYDIVVRLRNNTKKIFNPFDINENDNDIIEYHGDINPD